MRERSISKYEMNLTWGIIILIYLSRSSLVFANSQSSIPETSAEYLQKAMIELQELNVPTTIIYNQFPAAAEYKYPFRQTHEDDIKRHSHSMINQEVQKVSNQDLETLGIYPMNKSDMDHSASETVPQYYQLQVPAVLTHPKLRSKSSLLDAKPLGLTRAELAALYKNAMERGSIISLASLTNSLATNKHSQVSPNNLQLPVKQPMYHYYFFPLKTFASEVKKDNGYKTIITPVLENTEPAVESQKQLLTNPLFVAISTFISMALLFMVGVLFLPKLTQFGGFYSRGVQDDLLHLTNFVLNATDHRDSLNKLNRTKYRCNERKRKRR